MWVVQIGDRVAVFTRESDHDLTLRIVPHHDRIEGVPAARQDRGPDARQGRNKCESESPPSCMNVCVSCSWPRPPPALGNSRGATVGEGLGAGKRGAELARSGPRGQALAEVVTDASV